jgi:hypothetical protein
MLQVNRFPYLETLGLPEQRSFGKEERERKKEK